jgi:hypothetical protein
MNSKKHLTPAGFQKIINLRASINKGLSDTLSASFPNTIPVPRPLVVDQQIKDPHWLAGFVSGDGCFIIIYHLGLKYKFGLQVTPKFIVSQHSREAKLMKSLKEYLNCGRYTPKSNEDMGEFIVSGISANVEKIIPFFKKYKIVGVKALDFSDFCKVAELITNKEHLTKEGLVKINSIKRGMNRGRQISTWARPQLGQVRKYPDSVLQRGIHTVPKVKNNSPAIEDKRLVPIIKHFPSSTQE